MKLLVTGGAGFIGSVVTEQLVAEGHDVVVLDNLKYGFPQAVTPPARFVRGDILGRAAVAGAFPPGAVRGRRPSGRRGVHRRLAPRSRLVLSRQRLRRIEFARRDAPRGREAADFLLDGGRVRPAGDDSHPGRRPEAPCNSYGESKLAFERTLAWYPDGARPAVRQPSILQRLRRHRAVRRIAEDRKPT